MHTFQLCLHSHAVLCHAVLCHAVLQDALDAKQAEGDVQLDASQLAEYRALKAQADDKTGRLLQEKAALEAQLKVRGFCIPQGPLQQHKQSVCRCYIAHTHSASRAAVWLAAL